MDHDPKTSLQHYPLPMKRYGTIPGRPDENLYRIIWAPSRRSLVGGRWADGRDEYRSSLIYRHIGDLWVMERWLPAREFAEGTEADWNAKWKDPRSGLLKIGPYPTRGEYQHCHTFEACTPADASVSKLVMWIEAGRKRSRAENHQAIKEEYEKDTLDRRSVMDAMVRNTMHDHLGSTAGPFVSRVGKTLKTPRTARQLGLPESPNKFITGNPMRRKNARPTYLGPRSAAQRSSLST